MQNILVKNRQNLLSRFFKPISILTEIASIKVTPEGATCLARTADQQLVLYTQSKDLTADAEIVLNIKDCKNFEKLLDVIPNDCVTLIYDVNNLTYKSKTFKFKHHLLDESLVQQFSLNVDKIENFETDVFFTVAADQFDMILKKSSIVTAVNKVYISFVDGQILAEITDKLQDNMNSITISIGETDIICDKIFPVSLEVLRNLSYSKKDILGFKLNLQLGVFILEISDEFNKLKYLITTLAQ